MSCPRCGNRGQRVIRNDDGTPHDLLCSCANCGHVYDMMAGSLRVPTGNPFLSIHPLMAIAAAKHANKENE